MRFNRFASSIAGLAVVSAMVASAAAEPIPRIERRDDRFMLLVDGKPYFVLAAQLHNSSAWPAMLPEAWRAAEALAPNTIEVPIYWEQFEAQKGRFDTTNVDALIAKARETGKRLVFLWFGTWKNGQMHYVPEWVKGDPARYPRTIDERGLPTDVLSPHSQANLDADRSAYTALLAHLKKVDGERHTVIMVQVENEPGAIGAVRDHGAEAEAAFRATVPAAVTTRLGKAPGDWRTVFGPDADEAFNAWATARYIEQIAAAGKAVYPLPTYVNVWMRYKGFSRPGGDYPSGGATWNMFDVWRSVTPSIDFIGTDVYTSDAAEYRKVLGQYARADNPSWVSETGFDPKIAPYLFYVLNHGGIGFSVFGIDDAKGPTTDAAAAAHRVNFALLDPIRDLIARGGFDHRLQAVVEEPGQARQTIPLADGWRVDVAFGPPAWGDTPAIVPNSPEQTGRAFVLAMNDGSFLVSGVDARLEFKRVSSDGRRGQLMRVEEGRFVDGAWQVSRWLNGDETDFGLNFGHEPRLLRVRVAPL
ncbi:DUF5597 domain-containing protein [Sphingomonas sp. NCPPB 2930]|uniref:DUF5597 domain-containing protein n=1 Tax=Sphingomonas sp. NCPPB 2930 TaxID=3162788 RepID=UPI0036D80A92